MIRVGLLLLGALTVGGCADILSILVASGLTGWLTNRDSCTVQSHVVEGKVAAETRICSETSILPKGLRERMAPAGASAPAGESSRVAGP